MTTSNNVSPTGSNSSKWCAATSSMTSGHGPTSTTYAEPSCGTNYDVNEIPSPGCYVCNWNGALMRVSDAAFMSGGFTSFNFTCTDPLTVTYLCCDPTATVEECRNWASGSNVYCNF